jgi:hypothetical protein
VAGGCGTSVAAATVIYRDALERVSQPLADLKSLHDGSDVEHATDVLWFYFGYVGLFTMHDENGWSYYQAEKWLADQAIHGVLATSAQQYPIEVSVAVRQAQSSVHTFGTTARKGHSQAMY